MENIHLGFYNKVDMAKKKKIPMALDPADNRKSFWLQNYVIGYLFIVST